MLVRNLGLFSLASLATSTATVHVVDAVHGPYFDIQSAVDASTDGDVVLVRSGTYPSFGIVAREVAVVADSGAVVDVQGSLRIRGLSADQTVFVAGLDTRGVYSSSTDSNGLRVSDCLGAVRAQDCRLEGGSTNEYYQPELSDGRQAGVRIRACADVLIARAQIVGGFLPGGYAGSPPMPSGGAGIDAGLARVALLEVDINGAHGGSCFVGCLDATSGGHGVFARPGSELFVHAGTISGGRGGSTNAGPFGWGGNGGSGLLLATPCPDVSLARVLGASFEGGAAGSGACSIFCNPSDYDGSPGYPTTAYPCGFLETLAGMAPTLSAPSVVREGGTLPLSLTGSPGDVLWLRVADEVDHTWDPARNGLRLLRRGLPDRWQLLGTVGASGILSHPLPIEILPPTVQARVLHMQVQAQRPDGSVQLGGASSFVVLDAAL